MKTILFIPTYTYLSTPIFERLLLQLKEFETVYLDVEDHFNASKSSESFQSNFDKIVKMELGNGSGILGKIKKIFRVYRFQKSLKAYIQNEPPSVIVTTSDLGLSLRVIKKYFPYIPIVVIQSAMIAQSGLNRTWKQYLVYIIFNKLLSLPVVQKQNYFGQEYDDNLLLLWGDYFRKMVNNRNHIYIIGDIALDTFPITKKNIKKENLLQNKNFPLNAKIVLVCTGAFGGLVSEDIVSSLYALYQQTILEHPNLYFIIKPHPREKENDLTRFIELGEVKNAMVSHDPLHHLFQYGDIHISSFSRTAVEALVSNIPIIVVNPENKIKLEDFLNNTLDEKVTNMREMRKKIDEILVSHSNFSKLREKYVSKILYRIDGKATQRAVDIIHRVSYGNE